MQIVRFLGHFGLGVLAFGACLAVAEPATAATCGVGNNVNFVSGNGQSSYAPGERISEWGVTFGTYWSSNLYPQHNGKVAVYVSNPVGGTLFFLRYTDNTYVTSTLAADVWLCANDNSNTFTIRTTWASYALPCQNCTFQLGPISYNTYSFGIDTLGGNDTVNGGSGTDKMWGNDGNDTFVGGAGEDWAYGGAGTDAASASTEHFYQN